jgi:hypothetical protein
MVSKMFGLGKILSKTRNTKVVKTKSGSSTFTKIKKQNGKTSWYKSGGTGSFKKRGRKAK